MTSMIRSALSATHFWARSRIRPRPSKPMASHSGCASRARAAMALISAGSSRGTVVMVSPVAGFSTGIALRSSAWVSLGRSSTVAMVVLLPRCLAMASLASAHQRHPAQAPRAGDDLAGVGPQPALQQAGVHRAEVDRHLQVVLAVQPGEAGILGEHPAPRPRALHPGHAARAVVGASGVVRL